VIKRVHRDNELVYSLLSLRQALC